MKLDDDIYWTESNAPARYSLFWHHSSGSVDCRIFSSEVFLTVYAKWLNDPFYGLACNIK